MEGWTDELMEGWTERQMDELVGEGMNDWIDRVKDGRVDSKIGG